MTHENSYFRHGLSIGDFPVPMLLRSGVRQPDKAHGERYAACRKSFGQISSRACNQGTPRPAVRTHGGPAPDQPAIASPIAARRTRSGPGSGAPARARRSRRTRTARPRPGCTPRPRLVRHSAQALGERRPEPRVAAQRVDHVGPRPVEGDANHDSVPSARRTRRPVRARGSRSPAHSTDGSVRNPGRSVRLRRCAIDRRKCIDSRRSLA
jgi:hypothetical protein